MLKIIKNLTHSLSLLDIPYKRFGKSMMVVRRKCFGSIRFRCRMFQGGVKCYKTKEGQHFLEQSPK